MAITSSTSLTTRSITLAQFYKRHSAAESFGRRRSRGRWTSGADVGVQKWGDDSLNLHTERSVVASTLTADTLMTPTASVGVRQCAAARRPVTRACLRRRGLVPRARARAARRAPGSEGNFFCRGICTSPQPPPDPTHTRLYGRLRLPTVPSATEALRSRHAHRSVISMLPCSWLHALPCS